MELKCFIKNEQGYNSHFDVDDFDFKSENEWRFVPEKWEIGNNRCSSLLIYLFTGTSLITLTEFNGRVTVNEPDTSPKSCVFGVMASS